MTGNISSGNLSHFIYHTIDTLREACDAPEREVPLQFALSPARLALVANCVFHSRILLRSLIETSSSDQLLQHLTYQIPSPTEDGSDMASNSIQLCFPLLASITQFLVIYAPKIDGNNLYVCREVVLLLLTLMATQLGANLSESSSEGVQQRHVFLDILVMSESAQLESFGDKLEASQLISTLLDHAITRKTFTRSVVPSSGSVPVENDASVDIEGGNAQQVAPKESAWSAFVELGKFFAFPFQEFARMLMTGDTAVPPHYAPFGDLCLYAVLLLLNYQSASASNPFRLYLSQLSSNLISKPSEVRIEASSSSSADEVEEFGIGAKGQKGHSFVSIYQSLVQRVCEDSTLILLYMLLQINQEFRGFLASRADLDRLVLPLMQDLYRAHEQTRARVYIIMIILTILSCDEHFIQTTEAVVIDTPSWFKEKFLRQLPLPEFIALVILRTSYLNLKVIKDSYLQENCMACLGNLASQLTNLSFYTSKRFIFTAQLFVQRYQSLLRKSRNISITPKPMEEKHVESDVDDDDDDDDHDHDDEEQYDFEDATELSSDVVNRRKASLDAKTNKREQEENPNTTIPMDGSMNDMPESHNLSGRELLETLESTENDIRTMLEIIDCMFRRKPASNIQLIYALILEPDLFSTLLSHQRLYSIAKILRNNTEYFLNEVQRKECDSAAQVIACLSTLALQWRTSSSSSISINAQEHSSSQSASSAAPIADLKFGYEETNAALFFTPCLWKLLLKHRADYFYWNPSTIVLYEVDTGLDPSFSGDDTPEDPPRHNVPENV